MSRNRFERDARKALRAEGWPGELGTFDSHTPRCSPKPRIAAEAPKVSRTSTNLLWRRMLASCSGLGAHGAPCRQPDRGCLRQHSTRHRAVESPQIVSIQAASKRTILQPESGQLILLGLTFLVWLEQDTAQSARELSDYRFSQAPSAPHNTNHGPQIAKKWDFEALE